MNENEPRDGAHVAPFPTADDLTTVPAELREIALSVLRIQVFVGAVKLVEVEGEGWCVVSHFAIGDIGISLDTWGDVWTASYRASEEGGAQ